MAEELVSIQPTLDGQLRRASGLKTPLLKNLCGGVATLPSKRKEVPIFATSGHRRVFVVALLL